MLFLNPRKTVAYMIGVALHPFLFPIIVVVTFLASSVFAGFIGWAMFSTYGDLLGKLAFSIFFLALALPLFWARYRFRKMVKRLPAHTTGFRGFIDNPPAFIWRTIRGRRPAPAPVQQDQNWDGVQHPSRYLEDPNPTAPIYYS